MTSHANGQRGAPWSDGPKGAGVRGWLFGPVAEFVGDRLAFFLSAMRNHGDFVRVRLGYRQVFIVSDPDGAKAILQDEYKRFDRGSPAYEQIRLVLRDGLFTSEGDTWRRHRKLAQPAFHRDRIRNWTATMAQRAVEVTDSLVARGGETTDVVGEMMRVTLQIVGDTLVSADLSSHAESIGQVLPEVIEELSARASEPLPMPLAVPTSRNRALRRAVATLESSVREIIAARRANPGTDADLLDMLMQARDESTGLGLDDEELRDEVLTFILAGHETTALSLTWALYLLSQNPDAAARVASELESVLGGRSPTFEEVGKLPYTRAVMMEAMRLYPPVWMLSRRAMEDVEVGSRVIPKGSITLVSPYLVHRNERVWRDPDSFRPERFLPGQEEQANRFAFLAFGGGPRVCIGAQFAQLEGIVILATLFPRVRLRLAKGARIELLPSLSLRPKHGMPMVIEAAPPR